MRGELVFGTEAVLRSLFRQREGLLLWIPLGGVDDTASGTLGGSSGSGGGGMGIPVCGERRSTRPRKGFRSSASGVGRKERRGAADKPGASKRVDRSEFRLVADVFCAR